MPQTMARAMAQALVDYGVGVVTHVPGHGATETFAAYRDITGIAHPISFHEEPAYAIAHGAALTGSPAACVIKSHGVTKAMNAIMDSLSCGVTAGFVMIVFEDKTGAHSDNIIEILPLLKGAELPHRVITAQGAYQDVIDAFRTSQMMQLPFTLVADAAEIEGGSPLGSYDRQRIRYQYHRDPVRHLVCPIFAPYQREVLLHKLRDSDIRYNVPRPPMPILPDSLPTAYQEAVRPYLPLFEVFRTLEVDFVCGDAGVSTLSAFPPYDIAHAALYMGGSIPTCIGSYLAGKKRSWAFIGDFSFIAAGHYGLIEALLRNVPIKVLIYANGRAQTTGGQPLDLDLLWTLLRGYEPYTLTIEDPSDPDETGRVLQEANTREQLTIVVAKYT